MNIDPRDAHRALDQIETARRKASSLRGYVFAAPHLMIWGAIWISGGVMTYLLPEIGGGWGWSALVLVGGLASGYCGMRSGSKRVGAGAMFARLLASALVAGAVVVLLASALGLDTQRAMLLVPLLLTAGAYVVFGIWRGFRIVVLGLVLGTGTLLGWAYLGDAFAPAACILGGATLIASGLWLRAA